MLVIDDASRELSFFPRSKATLSHGRTDGHSRLAQEPPASPLPPASEGDLQRAIALFSFAQALGEPDSRPSYVGQACRVDKSSVCLVRLPSETGG